MTNSAIRVLGLDPGLRRTGWGVIACEGARLRWVAHGVVAPPETAPFSERLLHLLEAVGEVCAPSTAATRRRSRRCSST